MGDGLADEVLGADKPALLQRWRAESGVTTVDGMRELLAGSVGAEEAAARALGVPVGFVLRWRGALSGGKRARVGPSRAASDVCANVFMCSVAGLPRRLVLLCW